MKLIYDEMWLQASKRIRTEGFETDPLIDDPSDSRRGISLIFRPHSSALEGLVAIQERLRSEVSGQFFPAIETLHVTGLSIITCIENFLLKEINVESYADAIEDVLVDTSAFDIEFKGLTASPSCVMAQGFADVTLLSQARNLITRSMEQAGLEHTVGQRYPPRTAHCTLLRFKTIPSCSEDLLQTLAELRSTVIGSCRISEAVLVFNDWYHDPSIVRELRRIPLK